MEGPVTVVDDSRCKCKGPFQVMDSERTKIKAVGQGVV